MNKRSIHRRGSTATGQKSLTECDRLPINEPAPRDDALEDLGVVEVKVRLDEVAHVDVLDAGHVEDGAAPADARHLSALQLLERDAGAEPGCNGADLLTEHNMRQ